MAGGFARLEGLETVMSNLNREIGGIENRGIDGLLAGGLLIQGESQKRVPVEHGFLRASAYTRRAMENRLAVEIGYTSAYALFVHEMQQVNAGEPRASGLGVYWGPNGEPKFLENAVQARADDVVNIVAAYAGRGL